MLRANRYLWCALAIISTGAFLRIHGISRVPLWADETDFFTQELFHDPAPPLVQYARAGRSRTTNNIGWFAAVWTSVRIFGHSPVAARLPSLVFSVGFLIVLYQLALAITGAQLAALTATAVAAASVPLLEHAQRAFAYGGTPLFASLIILAHLALRRRMDEGPRSFAIGLAWYTAAVLFSLFMHLSLTPLIAASAVMLALRGRWSQLRYAAPAAALILCGAYVNGKMPTAGFRPYLEDYYPQSLAGFLPFVLTRTYDLLTYQFDFLFDPRMYWPLSLNPVLLPLVALCVFGWVEALRGRSGRPGRELALLAALTTAILAVMSLLRIFPFGGVRQDEVLAPAFAAFLGIGVNALPLVRWTRIAAIGLALVYFSLWATTLPSFYRDRTSRMEHGELATIWEREGRLPLYAAGAAEIAMLYETLDHPEIRVQPFSRALPDAPFLLVSQHWPLSHDAWVKHREQQFVDKGYRAIPLIERPARHLDAWRYPGCVYFPPVGFWVYRVEAGQPAPASQ